MDVPDQILTKIICSQCTELLSVLPIHSYENGDLVCGRCPLRSDRKARRDFVYEAIAGALNYPCRYKSHGCNEVLPSSKLQQHENWCYYKQSKCPTTDCKWQGFITDLEEHYLKIHSDLIVGPMNLFYFSMRNNNWKLSLLKNLSDNLFLIELKTVDSQLLVNVYLLNKNNAYIKHHFNITLESEAGIVLETPEKNVQNLFERQDPCKFEIRKSYVNSLFAGNISITLINNIIKVKKDQDNLIKYILSQIECPVCFEYMSSPIYQCTSGHVICGLCNGKTTKCPQCRKLIGYTRNLILENIAEIIQYPCKNEGCDYITTFQELEEHINICNFAPYSCPFKHCIFENNYGELLRHLTDEHNGEFEKNQITRSDGFRNCEENVILKNNSIFIECHCLVNNELNIKVTRLGPKNQPNNFFFVVNINSEESEIRLKAKCLNWDSSVPHEFIELPLAKLNPYNPLGNWSYKIQIIEQS